MIYAIHTDGGKWPVRIGQHAVALSGEVSRSVPLVCDTDAEASAVRRLGYRVEVKEGAKA